MQDPIQPPVKLNTPLLIILSALLYFGMARFSLLLAFENTNASPIWPPAGFALAVLMLWGYRAWPGILLGALLANFTAFLTHPSGPPDFLLVLSFLIALGNTFEALMGTWLLKRQIPECLPFARVSDSFRFVATALLMCLTSALMGPLSLCATGVSPWALFGTISFTWWLGDVVGVLLVAPVLLLLFRPDAHWNQRSWIERLLTLLCLVLVSQMCFGDWFHQELFFSQPYLLLPLLLWIVFRFGAREALLGVLLVSALANLGTVHGMGPFVRASRNDSLLLLQLFMGVVSITVLVMAAALNEKGGLQTNGAAGLQTSPDPHLRRSLWFPLALSLGLSLISLMLGLALHTQEQNQMAQTIETQLKNTHQLIRLHLDTRILALLRMGRRWEVHGRLEQKEWESDALAYIQDFKSFYRLSWVDPTLHVGWTVPSGNNQRAQGVYIGGDPIRRKALDAARRTRRFAVTDTIRILQGGQGFIVYVPVFHGPALLGYIAAVFSYQDVLEQLLGQGLGRDYAFEVRDPQAILYQHNGTGEYVPEWAEISELKLHGITWQIRIWPSLALVRQQLSPLPQLTSLVGLLLALLLGWTTYLSRRLRQQNLSIQANNYQLSAEIAERQRTEAALRESRDKWQTLIDQIKDAVLIADFDESFFLEANPQACELFAYSPDEFRRLQGRDLIAAEGQAQTLAFLAELRQQGFAQNPAMPLLTRHGNRFWGDLRATVFEVGKRKMVVNVIRDVTARVQTEQELMNAKKFAEEASQAKGEFLANMSHEIRTPLNAIIGLNHLLMRTPLSYQQQDYVRNNQQAARSLLGLINDVLDVSKIEAGMLALESAVFELRQVFQHLFNLVSRSAQEKGLELLVRLPADLPVACVGDRLRLEQVLVNLVSNAIKFTERGEVELAIESVQTTSEQVKLAFSIRDTGIGIKPEESQHLFQAFSQADSSITRRYGGSGLGLAISHHLVSLMGGELCFDSQPGQGSTFYFQASFGLAGEAAASVPDLPDLSHLRALVLDDNSRSLEILQGYLQGFGLSADTLRVGPGLDPVLPQADYDLLLLDWPLSKDGLTLLGGLQRQPQVMVMLGDGAELPDPLACPLEINALLVKPIIPVHLAEALLTLYAPPDEKIQGTEQSQEEQYAERLRRFAGTRILLVEDNRINQRVAQELLASQGFQVDIANQGQEALACLREKSYALVLMDLQMPVMDGFAATREIRQMPEYQDLPIVAMTADVIAGTREQALKAGMNDYITKPIELETLYRVLWQWLTPGSRLEPLPVAAAGTALPELEGIDALGTLRRLGGNLAFYLELLQEFESALPQHLGELGTALARSDRDIALYLAHTLKGMAANLGLLALLQALQELEQTLQAKQSPDAAWQACEQAVARCLSQLTLLKAQSHHLSDPGARV